MYFFSSAIEHVNLLLTAEGHVLFSDHHVAGGDEFWNHPPSGSLPG